VTILPTWDICIANPQFRPLCAQEAGASHRESAQSRLAEEKYEVEELLALFLLSCEKIMGHKKGEGKEFLLGRNFFVVLIFFWVVFSKNWLSLIMWPCM